MFYVNMKGKYGIETVDEFGTRDEADRMRYEYALADSTGHYYVSTRCTNEWKDAK